jgi:hypothetical protein
MATVKDAKVHEKMRSISLVLLVVNSLAGLGMAIMEDHSQVKESSWLTDINRMLHQIVVGFKTVNSKQLLVIEAYGAVITE